MQPGVGEHLQRPIVRRGGAVGEAWTRILELSTISRTFPEARAMRTMTGTETKKRLYGLIASVSESHEPLRITGRRSIHSSLPPSLIFVLLAGLLAPAASSPESVAEMKPTTIFRDPSRYTTFPDVKRLPSGDLLCVFRDATFPEHVRHIEKDARVVGAVSKDGGLTWSAPTVIHECTRCHNDPSVAVLRDGRLLLTWFTWVGRSEAYVAAHKPPFARKVDRGEWGMYAEPGGIFTLWGTADPLRWTGEPIHIVGESLRLAATSASALETRGGDLLMPIYMRLPDRPPDRAYVLRSSDRGATWSEPILIAEDPGGKIAMQEPALAENRDGTIVALMRTTNAEDHLYTVRSEDEGKTWTPAERTPLVGHPADLELLPDGSMLAVYGYRHEPGWGVRGCVSRDGGVTWDAANELVIADHGAHSDLGYPSVCQADPEHVVVAYYMNGPDTRDRWIECKRIPLKSLP